MLSIIDKNTKFESQYLNQQKFENKISISELGSMLEELKQFKFYFKASIQNLQAKYNEFETKEQELTAEIERILGKPFKTVLS